MGQGILQKCGDVAVGEGVVEVVPLPAAGDKPFAAQDAEPLRHAGKLLAKSLDHLADAHFFFGKHAKDA
jgi:hypothetical protein